MQHLFVENLRIGFGANAAVALRLAGSVDAADCLAQPAAGMNHPAWILKHLSTYHPVVIELLTGGDPIDPKHAPFGMTSEPEADPAVYGPWDQVVAEYRHGTERVLAALRDAESLDPGRFTRTMPVERWRERFPAAGSALAYLLVHHEGFHLGQFSAWRRARGLPRI